MIRDSGALYCLHPFSNFKYVRSPCYFAERGPSNVRRKWAIFGKQNWRCGMNRTTSSGARINAHQIPQKVLVDIDSRTVAMEVGIR